MRRRVFITLIGCAVGWPHAVAAQPSNRKDVPIIGFLVQGSEVGTRHFSDAFRSGLESLGYLEGQNNRVYSRVVDRL